MQLSTLLSVDTWPAAHAMHVEEPAEAPWFARLPAGHDAHPVTFELAVNSPAGHAVHEVPPVPTAPVKLPPAQVAHDCWPDWVWYSPAKHAGHSATFEAELERPWAQIVQDWAPVPVAPVKLPGLQVAHDCWPPWV